MFASGISRSTALRRPVQLAWTAWVLFLAIVVVTVFTSTRQGVYPIFAQAGRAWLDSEALYDLRPDLDQFLYTPMVAAAFAPLSLLPDGLGGVIWRLAGVAFFGWACATYLCRFARTGSGDRFAWAWLLMLPLVGGSIHNGQTNIFLLGLLLMALVALRDERWWLAAVGLGIAGLFKVYPLFLVLLTGAANPRQLPWRVALVVALGLAAPFLLQGPDYVLSQYQGFWETLRRQDRALWTLERAPRDLFLLTRLTGSPMPLGLYRAVQAVLTMLIVAAVWRRRGAVDFLPHAFILSCCWMITLGPAAESSTYCLLAPCLILVLLHRSGRQGLVWLIYGLLAASAVACWFPAGKHWAAVVQPLAGLAFLVERLAAAWRHPETALPGTTLIHARITVAVADTGKLAVAPADAIA